MSEAILGTPPPCVACGEPLKGFEGHSCYKCVQGIADERDVLFFENKKLKTELVALKASQKEAHKLLKYACDWLEYLGQPRVITRPNNKFTFQDIYSYFNSLPSLPETTEEKGEA